MNTATTTQSDGEGISGPGDSGRLHCLSVTSLTPDHSLRQIGIDQQHVRALAECYDVLPPILVHRSTMKVIDGNHRLMAAKLLDKEHITAQFFDGDADAALAAALQANFAHGLPLTLADRTRAASRLIGIHPDWSDRRIAATVGLSPKTAGAVRRRRSEEIPQTTERIGRDGRRRSLPAPRGRQRSVLQRSVLQRNDSAAATELVVRLSRDPSMRQSEDGRFLLRMLDLHLRESKKWAALVANVPPHRARSIAELALECAKVWSIFSESVASAARHNEAVPPR